MLADNIQMLSITIDYYRYIPTQHVTQVTLSAITRQFLTTF